MKAEEIVTVEDLAQAVYVYGRSLLRLRPKDLREPGAFPGDPVGGDCRLQIHDGTWALHTGSADYDQDHRGAWGAAFCPRGCTRAEARVIAAALIAEADEMLADEEDDDA